MASVAPVDQGSILRSGAALIPDITEQIMRERLLGLQEQQQQTQIANLALRQQEALREQRQRTAYQTAVQQLGERPSLDGIASLMLRFPEASEAARRAYESLDSNQQRTEFRAAAELHSALVNNTPDVAARILRDRIEADRAAGGEPDQVDQLMLDAIESGDPARIATARSIARRNAAIMAGPTQFASVYGADDPDLRNIAAGDVLYDENQNRVVFESPYIRGGDGTIYERRPSGAAGNAPAPTGDPSRVMNFEARAAGFQSVPATVRTLGQASDFAQEVNRAGVRSSAMGTYQIVGDTLRRYAPRVFGEGWRNVDFTPENQERIAQAIFNDNRGSASALRGQWVSLSQEDAERVRQMPWAQARVEIARRESGSGAQPQGNQPVRVRSVQEAMRLAPGTPFITPDGQSRVRR
jgi:hypothetical protein